MRQQQGLLNFMFLGRLLKHADGFASHEAFQAGGGGLARTLNRAWGLDDLYQRGVVAPVKLLAVFIAVVIDQLAIDGAVNAVGRGARRSGESLKRFADGSIAGYGLWMGAGAALLVLLLTWMGA